MTIKSVQSSNMKGVSITPFDSTPYTISNFSQILADRGAGIISIGLVSLTALSLLYKGVGRNHIGLFNNERPPTTVSVFNSLSDSERVDVVLRSISMKSNMDSYANKQAQNYITLMQVVELMVVDIMDGRFVEGEYKYTLINLSKSIVRTMRRQSIRYGGITV